MVENDKHNARASTNNAVSVGPDGVDYPLPQADDYPAETMWPPFAISGGYAAVSMHRHASG